MIHPTIDPAREALVRRVDGVADLPAKVCSKCRRPKPTEEFGPDARRRDGHRSRCRNCERILAFIGYHECGGREKKAAYMAREEVKAMRARTRPADRARHRDRNRAYLETPRGKLVHGRACERIKLRDETDEARRDHCRSRIALFDAEIARLDREGAGEPEVYRGVSPLPDGRFEVNVYVAGRGTVYGGRFATFERARDRVDAIAPADARPRRPGRTS